MRVFVVVMVLYPMLFAQPKFGSICVAPIPPEPPHTAATPELFCKSGKLSLRIDDREAVSWPHDESLKLSDLSQAERHRVAVLCDGKPQQTFRFRFSEFRTDQQCLFINDLYQTVQLWESRQAPWCTCK